MLRSFILIAFRKLRNRASSSFVSFVCLTLGLSACFFIFNYVHFELTYDKYNESDLVYRLETHRYQSETLIERDAFTPLELSARLLKESEKVYGSMIPYTKDRMGFFKTENNHNHQIENIFYASHSILDILNLKLIQGDLKTVLKEPNAIVISESTAEMVFKDKWKSGVSLIGKKLKSGERGLIKNDFIIVGIIEDIPANSHLSVGALISPEWTEWTDSEVNGYTYVKLKSVDHHSDIDKISSSLTNTLEKRIYFQSIENIHTTIGTSNEVKASVSITLLMFLSAVGMLILGLASSNYINNAIINAGDRAKEIGIRKLMGVKPLQLTKNFVIEALLVNVLSSICAIVCFLIGVQLLIVYTDIGYPIPSLSHSLSYGLIISILIILSTILSSAYPSYYLSKLKPLESLQEKSSVTLLSRHTNANNVVKYLLIGQINLSVFFLSAVHIIYRQLNYLNSNDSEPYEIAVIGYFPGTANADQKYLMESLHYFDEFSKQGYSTEIKASNLSNGKMTTSLSLDSLFRFENTFPVHLNVIDNDYWKDPEVFLKGRNFNRQFGSDPDKMIVNEKAWNLLKHTSEDTIILNRQFKVKSGYMELIGVVKNNTENPPPKVYVSGYRYPTFFDMILRYPGKANQDLDEFIRECEYYFHLKFPFFHFIDKNLRVAAEVEKSLFGMFIFFSFIAVIISNLGMYSLAEFIAQKRMKEIAIRKILGADTKSVLKILIVDFLKIMITGCIIALPLILYFARIWLDNYTRRIPIEIHLVALPILISILIPLSIVLLKCWDTAEKNPLKSLH